MKGIPSKPLRTPGAAVRGVCVLAAALALAACGGKSSNSSSYTIGGTITGLSAGSVVLANGSQSVTVSSSATTWSFASPFAAGSSYAVVVETQPSGELCEVTSGGSGASLSGNVNDVAVVCSDYGQWIWEGGLSTVNVSGAYGTQGAGTASNAPGARQAASSWIDASGNLWVFGGYGFDATGDVGDLNDLWQFSPSTGVWTWISGGSATNATGVYGTQGTAAAGNLPGARYSANAWIDASGNLWLFGGYGYDSTGHAGRLNDLWQYSPGTGQWTWISGDSADNGTGVYGTQGTAVAGNVPGARQAANAWADSSGNLWLFGGYGYGSSGSLGYLNDLWHYTPSTGLWTWVSGGSGENASGVYGTQGTAAAGNVLGARQAASSWIDASGELWIFGGYGYDSAGDLGALNDLWKFTPSTRQWTWVSGGAGQNAFGVYGTEGTAAANSAPGARQAANAWADSSGHLWLFGGAGYGSNANGYLNDLWQFVPP